MNPLWRVCTCIKSSSLSPPLFHQYRASLLLRALSLPQFYPTVFLRIIEIMISKSFNKFVALILITSSLTYSVNATPMIAPSRQSLFLDLFDQVLTSRLTSDSGFARAQLARAGSPVTSEKRQLISQDKLNSVVYGCQPTNDQITCLINTPEFDTSTVYYCYTTSPGSSQQEIVGYHNCMSTYCPAPRWSTQKLLGCITDYLYFPH